MMLYIKNKTMKIGGKYIPCEVVSVKVDENAVIDDVEDEKGKTKKNQPVGYDPFKITVTVNFMKTSSHTVNECIEIAQRLFKTRNQSKPKLMRIVNSYVAARGITKAYFSGFSTTKDSVAEIVPGTLEFTTQRTSKVLVQKKKKSRNTSSNDKSSKSQNKTSIKESNSKTKKNMSKTAAKEKNKLYAREAKKVAKELLK